MAFVSNAPSLFQSSRSSASHACICMKTRKNSKGAQKKPKKSDRATVAAKGFAAPENGVARRNSRTVDSDGDVVREQTSGAEGDATPHRASVLNIQTLEDPRNAISPESPTKEERITLPSEKLKSLRFDWGLSLDELIEKFEDARQLDTLDAVVEANRHFVTESLLYRFTSAILRVESEKGDKKKAEEARNMRELRRRLVAICWQIDTPFKRAILEAEERLMFVLQSGDIRRNTDRMAGKSQLDVDAFWIVVYAAVSAWEEQGRENPALVKVDMQEALSTAASTCRDNTRISGLLSQSLKLVGGVLNLSDPSAQAEVLDSATEEDIVSLATFVEQIRLLPTNAYDGIFRRMQTILDFLLSKKYGIQATSVEPIRFTPPEIVRGSKLAGFLQSQASN